MSKGSVLGDSAANEYVRPVDVGGGERPRPPWKPPARAAFEGAPFGAFRAAAVAGSEDAFAAIWREYHPRVVRYLRVLTPGEAEDVAAEVWLQVARNLVSFSGSEPAFRAWLFTIARHRAVDWARARRRRPHIAGSEVPDMPVADDTDLVDDAGSTSEALALIGRLPVAQAEAVLLRVIAGLDVDQTAAVMGKRPGTVRVLAHRGLRRLATIIAADSSDPFGPTEVRSCNEPSPRDA